MLSRAITWMNLKTLFPNKTGIEGQRMNGCMDMKYMEQACCKARIQRCLMGRRERNGQFCRYVAKTKTSHRSRELWVGEDLAFSGLPEVVCACACMHVCAHTGSGAMEHWGCLWSPGWNSRIQMWEESWQRQQCLGSQRSGGTRGQKTKRTQETLAQELAVK